MSFANSSNSCILSLQTVKKRAKPEEFVSKCENAKPVQLLVSGLQLLLLSTIIQPENEEDLWEEGEGKGR